MQSNLTKIDLPNAQSVCYHQKIDGKDFFWKEYKSVVDKKTLELYHTLHQTYEAETINFKLPCSVTVMGNKVTSLEGTILRLSPEEIYDGCQVSSKEEILITMPQYVAGSTLGEFSPLNRHAIMSYLSNGMPMGWMRCKYGLNPLNIKVNSCSEGVLRLTITDLAMNIPEYVDIYKADTWYDTVVNKKEEIKAA